MGFIWCIVYRQCSVTGTLGAVTDAQGRTIGLSRVQGFTTGTLAAASEAQGRTGLGFEGRKDPLPTLPDTLAAVLRGEDYWRRKGSTTKAS